MKLKNLSNDWYKWWCALWLGEECILEERTLSTLCIKQTWMWLKAHCIEVWYCDSLPISHWTMSKLCRMEVMVLIVNKRMGSSMCQWLWFTKIYYKINNNSWRNKGDYPSFVKLKYLRVLKITRLTLCSSNLYCNILIIIGNSRVFW